MGDETSRCPPRFHPCWWLQSLQQEEEPGTVRPTATQELALMGLLLFSLIARRFKGDSPLLSTHQASFRHYVLFRFLETGWQI